MISRVGIINNKDKYMFSKPEHIKKPVLNHTNNKILPYRFNDYKLLTSFSFQGLSETARRKAKYPQDHLYRSELAKNIGCKPDALMSVLGKQEFKDLLSTLKSSDYEVGSNYSNVNEGLIKANLHTHTTDSDGRLTVESLLDQAVSYADRMKNPPFVFSITNHDIMVDTKKALQIIALNPDKYKNIRFVTGMELTTRYKNTDILVKPVQIEVLSYCFNPFDKKLNQFLETNRKCNINYARDLTQQAGTYGLKVDFDKLIKQNRYIEINGNLYILRKYLLKLADQAKVDEHAIYELFEKHRNKYGSILLSKGTPTIQQIGNTFEDSMLTMAHPGRYGFYDPSDRSTLTRLPKRINKYMLQKGIVPEQALKVFLTEFKNTCGEAIEAHYQYGTRYPDLETNPWILAINKVIDELGLVKTGGTDTHAKDLFSLN